MLFLDIISIYNLTCNETLYHILDALLSSNLLFFFLEMFNHRDAAQIPLHRFMVFFWLAFFFFGYFSCYLA